MRRSGAAWQLRCADGQLIDADRVVLATGHPLPELPADQARFADFATGDARLRYVPCGLEPVLVAGSRSGVPLPARGVNQKGPLWRYRARLFTPQRVATLRAAGRPLDFRTQVWPWLHAEMQLVYYATEVRARLGDRAEQEFLTCAAALVESAAADAADQIVRAAAARFGVDDVPPLDVDDLARPFTGRSFRSPAAFHTALRRLIDDDLEHAARGNLHGPRKAALDVLRDVRGSIRRAVDFDGLTAASHRADFLGWFAPLSSFLAAAHGARHRHHRHLRPALRRAGAGRGLPGVERPLDGQPGRPAPP
jgi:methylaspartate mutase epsilon subunit